MKQKRPIFKWLIAAWLLMISSLTVHARIDARHETWGYSSTIRTSSPSVSSTYQAKSVSYSRTPAYQSISAYDPNFGQGAQLSTFFRSTTADSRLTDYSAGQSGSGGMRRAWDWSEPTENPTGVVDNPTPVGEPLVLLVMAMLYIGYLRLRRNRAQRTENV